MSGEFGSYNSGYFWAQMQYAAEDCRDGQHEITRLWGEFLAEFEEIARAISWAEAGDSWQDESITETIRRLPVLKERMRDIEKYVDVFDRVAQKAVRDALAKGKVANDATS